MNPHGESYSLLTGSEPGIRKYEKEGNLDHEI